MKHSSFDVTISALDVETSAFGAATSAIARRSFDATISASHREMNIIGVASRRRRSMRRRRRSMRSRRRSSGVTGDCGVGITLKICNRGTNHGDMSAFSKPAQWGTPSCSQPQPATDNGIRDGRSN